MKSLLALAAIAGCAGHGATNATPDGGGEPDAGGPRWIDRCDELAPQYAAPAIPGPPLRTLYVDGGAGDDSRSGLTATDAWRTLAKVNASVRAGDLVLISGAFTNDHVAPAASGTATDRIVYRAADPNTPPTLAIGNGLTAIS